MRSMSLVQKVIAFVAYSLAFYPLLFIFVNGILRMTPRELFHWNWQRDPLYALGLGFIGLLIALVCAWVEKNVEERVEPPSETPTTVAESNP
ncbi:MAG: hypothetical protein JWM46_466 [Candidatus Kaiserbacteria bacterium]|nr:hypothetical protein [Candidatus Kaiserbacteria bacterium]